MPNTLSQTMSRRAPLRMDAQNGPWSVSVADNPYDKASYNLYVKTPTHNLTLTRTAIEIVELHHKLHDAAPSATLPQLPLEPASYPSPPPKRKSAFLSTLSRLASPAGKAAGRQTTHRRASSPTRSTPIEPGASATVSAASSTHNATPSISSTATGAAVTSALATYMTAISNEAQLRTTRPWKRFFRVRTDDLESVRVERAIKRVRSDLASHASPKSPKSSHVPDPTEAENITWSESDTGEDGPDSKSDLKEPSFVEEDEVTESRRSEEATVEGGLAPPAEDRAASPASTRTTRTTRTTKSASQAEAPPAEADGEAVDAVDDEEGGPSTPHSHDAPRIPRSVSAEQAKNSRLSRAYPSPSGDATPSETGDEDESSMSTRKKRARSMDPNRQLKKSTRKVVLDDFSLMRVLGKGCAGKVLLVRHKQSSDLYALKAITKRHVLAHQELQHTLTEQAVLKRMAAEGSDPFVVKLWWSFHDKENLFLVMDFHPGGDLATQLARWGRLGRDRARFYAAEIIEGVEGLHAAGVIYRDLKPENVLIGGDGHIVLTDFGLSKEFPRRTSAITAPSTPSGTRGEFYSDIQAEKNLPAWMKDGKHGESGWQGPVGQSDQTSTFCGTAEYLAPEVIQGLPYSYEVDWWSFGTMLYEMLTGITPFWANNHADMYVRVLQDELQFPDDRTMDQDTKSLIRGLLQRNPTIRISEPRIKKHPYFSMIDWSHVYYKRYIPPYIPPTDPQNAGDTQNFDETFLDMAPVVNDPNDVDPSDTDREGQTDTDQTDGEDSVATPLQSRSPSVHPVDDDVDVFDGYSFKGRHSILIDDDEDSSEGETEEDDDEDRRSETPGHLVEELAQAAAKLEENLHSEPLAEEEPKTPEARKTPLPEVPPAPAPVEEVPPAPTPPTKAATSGDGTLRGGKGVRITEPTKPTKPDVPPKEEEKEARDTVPPMKPARPSKIKGRKEKSGIPALDRYLSEDEGGITEFEDDDWDFIEATGEEEHNGSKGSTLFARGVVDRYRLAVFRKGPSSTPQKNGSRSGAKVTSADQLISPTDSPSPSGKRRGRTPLTFRRQPKEFLRAKSPPTSFSTKSRGSGKTLSKSSSAALSASSSSSANIVTPSVSGSSTMPNSPSLRTKESVISVGTTPSMSSTDSNGRDETNQTSPEEERPKNKTVLKKYKEASEKVLSLFASPRQP